MNRFLTTTLSACLLLECSAAFAEGAPLRMGISGFALPEHRTEIVRATEKVIRPMFGEDGLTVRDYTVSELEEAVRRGEVDIILSSAGLARRVSPYGVRPLVTVTAPGLENPNSNEGSLLVVRADSSVRTLDDLKGASVSANLPWGFSGWQIALGEVAAAGHDPDRFFGEKVFVGRSAGMTEIAQNVRSGRTVAGVLRLCAYESMAETDPTLIDGLRIVSERREPGVACRVSTQLYPAQTLSVTPRVDAQTARELMLRLLQMAPTADGRYWSVASDFHHVDELLKTLKIGPYRYLREWSLRRFLEVAWPWLMLACFLVAGLYWHSRRTERLLALRGELLGRMFAREAEQAERLTFLQRSNTVNQISSMVAHDLRQPLAALGFYADGLRMMVDLGRCDEDKLQRFSRGITKEVARASSILDSVRAYARNSRHPRRALVVDNLIEEAIGIFQAGRPNKIHVAVKIAQPGLSVKGNELELTLVFVNLLKNAREAVEKEAVRKVCIEVRRIPDDGATVEVRVLDNGPRLSDARLSGLGQPISSSKPDGLGLGLSIVRTIVEAHGGRLMFSQAVQAEYSGLCAVVRLPALDRNGGPDDHEEADDEGK